MKILFITLFMFAFSITFSAFFAGIIEGSDLIEKKCKLTKYQSYIGIIAVPFYYSFWIGCELTEPRFNLND